MDFGFGLGGGGGGGSHFEDTEWEVGFRLNSLSMEVGALVQERRTLWQQLEGAHEGVRALSGAVEALAAEVRDLRASGGGGRSAASSGRGSGWSLASNFAPGGASGGAVASGLARARAATQQLAPPMEDFSVVKLGMRKYLEDDEESEGFEDQLEGRYSESHELECSIWDACLFVGLGVLGKFDAVVLMMCYLVNLFVQFLFTVIIWSRFCKSPFSEDLVDNLRKWRATYGHDSMLVNPTTQESIVANVCSGSETMTNSQVQAELYTTMREFLPRFMPDPLNSYIRDSLHMPFYDGESSNREGGIEGVGFHLSGVELCTMLMMLWTLMICRELRGTYETHSAVWTKARMAPLTTDLTRNANGHLVLRAITVTRATWITVFVTLPRFVIACLLLVGGSYFIVAAGNMEDLILNALSLEFIIHTDELLYSVIASKNTRMIVEEVQPLRLGQFWNRFRTHFKVFMILGIVLYVFMVNEMILGPVVSNMKAAMTTMCGGDIKFVSRRYSDGVVRTVDPVTTSEETVENSYGYCAVLQRTGLAGATVDNWWGKVKPLFSEDDRSKCARMKSRLGLEATGTGELRRKGDMLLSEEDLYKKGACADRNLTKNQLLRLLVQDASGNHFATTCADAKYWCGHPPDAGFTSTMVRLYCPQTCACATAGMFFAGSGEGCPLQCKTQWEQMLTTSTQCTDMTPEQLRASPSWHQYVSSVVRYLDQLGKSSTVSLARTINATAMSFGCEALTQARGSSGLNGSSAGGSETEDEHVWDFCSPTRLRGGFEGAEHRTIRYFCPGTCGCVAECGRDASCRDCPRQCAA